MLAALNDAARRAIEASRRGDRDAWARADADCLRDDKRIDD